MRWIALLVLFLVAPLAAQADAPTEWYLNGNGLNAQYQIFRFGDDGYPLEYGPVASPYGGLIHVAWPSAVKVGDQKVLFAHGYTYVDGWKWVMRWISANDGPFVVSGTAFTANASEPYGVGPSQILYEPDRAEPYTMVYLVRGAAGPGPTIAVATSVNGTTWTRRGTVLSASIPQDIGGVAVDYACRMMDGDYALFYSGYSADLSRVAAIVATAPAITGPFTNKVIMFEGNNRATSLTSKPGEDSGVVGAALELGMPHLIVDGTYTELVVPVAQDGSRVRFDRPLFFIHTNATIANMAAKKIDPSFAREHPDGSWDGIVVLYGPIPGTFAEYTTAVESPALTGPWTYKHTGLRFDPWRRSTYYSAENPTPLLSDASCALP